jgi:hypothetical protein
MSGTDSKAGGREYLYLFTQQKAISEKALERGGADVFFYHPIFWLVVTVLDIIAIVSVLKSGADSGTKLLWIILVILLPVLGMILYFLMGPGTDGRSCDGPSRFPARRARFDGVGFSRSSRSATASWSCSPRAEGLAIRGRRAVDADARPGQGRDGRRARAQPDALRAVVGIPELLAAIAEKLRSATASRSTTARRRWSTAGCRACSRRSPRCSIPATRS